MSLWFANLIGYWTHGKWVFNTDFVQQAAKLCVGVVQDWITLELAIRIRNTNGYSDISEATKEKLSRTGGALICILALTFVTWTMIVINSAR